jgi:hypothetical protein
MFGVGVNSDAGLTGSIVLNTPLPEFCRRPLWATQIPSIGVNTDAASIREIVMDPFSFTVTGPQRERAGLLLDAGIDSATNRK